MGLLYDATSKNVIATYKNVTMTTPIVISGTGIDDMFSIDDVEIAGTAVASDGSMVAWIKPAIIENATLMLQPASTAMNVFLDTANAQYLTAPIPGTIVFSSPTGLWNITFNNVVIKSGFKGYELGQEKVKDVPWKFSCELPDATLLNDLVALGVNVANLL